jgi:predicted lipid-binding transport protein (Tim44 family)
MWPEHAQPASSSSSRSEPGRGPGASRDRAVTAGMLGSRGLRSHSAPTRPVTARPEPPPAPAITPREPPAPRVRPSRVTPWIGPLTGVALGWLIASSVFFGGLGLVGPRWRLLPQLLLGTAIVVFVTLLRRRQALRARPAHENVAVSTVAATPPPPAATARPSGDSSLADGLRDIRTTDPKFDPTRLIGYIEMVFRRTHAARVSGDIDALRDRVTPQLYGELRAQYERVGSVGRPGDGAQIEIRAEVTEAWHEDGRDYVTAYITASPPDDAFFTFTRAAGINPWMLSAIQTAAS